MPRQEFGNCRRLRMPARSSAVALLLILAGCGTTPPSSAQPGPGTLTNKVRPLACSDFDPVTYSNGKPGVTKEDVAEALKDQKDPLGRARNILGDTNVTKGQIDVYMAQRRGLCAK